MRRFTERFHDELRSRNYPGQMVLGEFEQNSHLSEHLSRTVLVPDRTLLENVSLHRAAMTDARAKWIAAVYDAADAGFTNTQIGGMSGMTEAGIRQILKRNPRPRPNRASRSS